jgi:hypothetical protein
MNEELFKRSRNLKQYAEFIAQLREFQKLYDDYTQTVKDIVKKKKKNDILLNFLKEHRGKIMSILT